MQVLCLAPPPVARTKAGRLGPGHTYRWKPGMQASSDAGQARVPCAVSQGLYSSAAYENYFAKFAQGPPLPAQVIFNQLSISLKAHPNATHTHGSRAARSPRCVLCHPASSPKLKP